MKKTIALLMILALALGLLAGCGGGTATTSTPPATTTTTPPATTTTTPPATTTTTPSGSATATPAPAKPALSDKTITVAIGAEPVSLMFNSRMQFAGATNYNHNDRLIKWNPETGELMPWLATSWEMVDDTHWRIKLRQGVVFPDGEEFSSETLAATFKLMEGCKALPTFFDYAECRVEDKYTYIIGTKGLQTMLPERLAYCVFVYSKKSLDYYGYSENTKLKPDEGHPIATGEYILKEWVPAQYILFERNETYWKEDAKPYFKYLKLVFIAEAAARALALESGDIDFASSMPVATARAQANNPKVQTHYLNTTTINIVYLNQNNTADPNNPLKDVRVREAIFRLIDIDAIKEMTTAGKGIIGETSISPLSAVYDAPPKDWVRKVDVARAKQLLAEAGYPNGLTIDCSWSSGGIANAEMIQEMLRAGGITMNVTPVEGTVQTTNLQNGTYYMEWRSLSAMNYMENIRLTDGRIPHKEVVGGIGNLDKSFDAIADRCYAAVDMNERMAAYKAAQEYMRKNFCYIAMTTNIRIELSKPGLTPPTINGGGGSAVDYTTIRPVK